MYNWHALWHIIILCNSSAITKIVCEWRILNCYNFADNLWHSYWFTCKNIVLYVQIIFIIIILGCSTNLGIWTYITLNGIPIFICRCRAVTATLSSILSTDGRSICEVAHLADMLGVKSQGPAFREYIIQCQAAVVTLKLLQQLLDKR